MVLAEMCFMDLVMHRLLLHWLQSTGYAGRTEGCETGLSSAGRAGAAALCLSVSGD